MLLLVDAKDGFMKNILLIQAFQTFSAQVVSRHLHRQHSLDRHLLLLDGLVGHGVRRDLRDPARGETARALDLRKDDF